MFDFCPKCRTKEPVFDGLKHYKCRQCGWSYFHNVAAAGGVFITIENKLLLVVRAREPGRGLLDLPGGFVDPGESGEEAVLREVNEELCMTEDITLTFLGTAPNIYLFDDVTYHTLDLVYTARLNKIPEIRDYSELADLVLYPISEVPFEKLAFESVKTAFLLLKEKKYF
ncbi:MAG: NUDIX domain-containing protein [Planctomycetes bacterium]|nr:NUDIX domain-containing protein [Planctomycetota bacterium]